MNIFKSPARENTTAANTEAGNPEESYPGLPNGYSDPESKFFVHEELRALYGAAPALAWKQAQEAAESIARHEVYEEFKARDDQRRAQAREAGRSGKFEIDLTARAHDVRNLTDERMSDPERYIALARHRDALRYAIHAYEQNKTRAAQEDANRKRATCSVCNEVDLSTESRPKSRLGHTPGSYRACLRCYEGIEAHRQARRASTISPELEQRLSSFAQELPLF